MLDVTYMGVFVAGILSFLSPCVLPLVPPYLCYIGGQSIEDMTADGGVNPQMLRRIFLSALLFVFGFSTVFITLGATASVIGEWLADNLGILTQVAGVIIVVLGLHFIGILRIPLLYREARFETSGRPAGLVGAYVVGLAFAFGWTPCVGPVLAAILMVAGSEPSVTYGSSLLAVYSLGLGIPFLLAAVAMKPFMDFMSRFRKHMKTTERVIGGLLVLTGILFLTGSMTDMAFWILETFPTLGRIG